MLLSEDAKIIDFDTLQAEQWEVLDGMSKQFSKYDSVITNFDTLASNLDKITDPIDLKKAQYIVNTLANPGYYAALRGFDAIDVVDKKYLVICNRGKIIMADGGVAIRTNDVPNFETIKKQMDTVTPDNFSINEFGEIIREIDYSNYSLEQRIDILKKMASDKGMSLKELGSQKGTESIISHEIQSQADYFANVIRNRAEMAEPTITSMMQKLEINGAKLVGLECRLKGIDSLSRKILSDSMDLNQSLDIAANNIGDSVRYTLIIDEANYSTQVNDSLNQLINEGFVIRKIKNFWGDPIYQGINTSIISPDGIVFELQFHTADSFNTKETLNHLYYEIARNKFTTIEEKDLANSIMKEYQSRVKIPEGILGYNSVVTPVKKINTVDEMFTYFSEGNGNYGIDQGVFTNLRKNNPTMYKKMKTKLINEYGFNRLDAERFMSTVDAIGACNYAAEVNAIVAYFKNMPDEFEKIFGFPLYVKNADGKLSLNDAEILADLYYWGNAHSEEAVLFKIDENGVTTFNEEAIRKNDVGKITMVMQRGGGMDETIINEYLHSKSPNLHCSLTEVYKDIDITTISGNSIKQDLLSKINNGEEIVMGSVSTGKKPIIYTEINTGENYAISGGHWVKVTDVTDNGVIVSSWGKKCLVKFEDLQANAYFDFYSLKFSIK